MILSAIASLWWLAFAITATSEQAGRSVAADTVLLSRHDTVEGMTCAVRQLQPIPSPPHPTPAFNAAVYGNRMDNRSWSGTTATGATVTIPYSYPGGYWRNVVEALAWTTFACSAAAGLAGLIMYS